MSHEWRRGDYVISTDRARLDWDVIHGYISGESYWGKGRTLARVRRSVENSLPFGIYKDERLVGFGRVVTDYATFAWVADVFVLDEFRGQGLSKWLMEVMLEHPELQGFRRWVLATKDAHGLYRQFGFTDLLKPERWMERHDPNTEERPDYFYREPNT